MDRTAKIFAFPFDPRRSLGGCEAMGQGTAFDIVIFLLLMSVRDVRCRNSFLGHFGKLNFRFVLTVLAFKLTVRMVGGYVLEIHKKADKAN